MNDKKEHQILMKLGVVLFLFFFLLRQISFIPLNVTYGLSGRERSRKFPDLQFYFLPGNAEYSVTVNFITPSHMNITLTSEVKVNYKQIVKTKLCSLLEFDQSSFRRYLTYHLQSVRNYYD